LFPERISVELAPAAISLGERRIACDSAYGKDPWQGAIAALRDVQWKQHCKVTVILSSHFVRYALVPWSDALSGGREEEAYVRHHFAKVHGERARAWALRWSDGGGGARLGSAIDRTLLEEIKNSFPKGGKARLISLQPSFMAAANRWARAIPRTGAWLVLAEPERACVALHSGGHWRSVQSARGDWLALLERERHRLAGEVPDLALIAGAPAPHELPGWHWRELAA
jgi:hypothetical protein